MGLEVFSISHQNPVILPLPDLTFPRAKSKWKSSSLMRKKKRFINISANKTSSDEGPKWSPDGKKIAFTRVPNPDLGGAQSKLFIYDLGSVKTKPATTEWGSFLWWWSLVPSSSRIVTATADSGQTSIFEWSNKTPNFKPVTREGSYRSVQFNGAVKHL